MADSYYRTIKGKQYDREILEIVEKAFKHTKLPLNKNIAKSLFEAIRDGGDYTDIEKRSLKYIRENYTFSLDADEYLRTEIRKWSAKIATTSAKKALKGKSSAPAKKTKSQKSNRTSVSIVPDEEMETSESSHPIYESEVEEEIELTPEYHELIELNRRQKKQPISYMRYILIAVAIVVIICIFLIMRSCNRSSESVKNQIKIGKLEVTNIHPAIINNGVTSTQFKSRGVAIRYINDLKIGYIKQSLNISPEAPSQIATLAEALKTYPEINVRIKGHTCFIGGLDENKILSEERAKLIRDKLLKLGVIASQLDARGFGETTNIDDNYTEKGRIQNRRVDFSVLTLDLSKNKKQ